MRTRRRLDGGFADLIFGSHDLARAVVAESFTVGGGDLTAALELSRYDGPWTGDRRVVPLRFAVPAIDRRTYQER